MKNHIVTLTDSVKAWGTENFKFIFLQEVTSLGNKYLPLQQGLTSSSVALDDSLKLIIISSNNNDTSVTFKLGAFYTGIISGCSCSDDPTPTDVVNEYCEFKIKLDLTSGEACISL